MCISLYEIELEDVSVADLLLGKDGELVVIKGVAKIFLSSTADWNPFDDLMKARTFVSKVPP